MDPVAAMRGQIPHLILILYAFGDHIVALFMRHGDDVARDGFARLCFHELINEGFVDFQAINVKLLLSCLRRISCSEIIDRDGHAKVFQLFDGAVDGCIV